MAISVVQRATGTDTAGSNNTLSAVFGSNVTAGNTIIVIAFHSQANNTSFTKPTDSLGTNYGQIYDHNQASSFCGIRVWANYNIGSGANTVTMAPDGNNPTSIVCLEVAGLATTNAFDLSAQQDQSSTGSLNSTATSMTTFANELLLGIFMTDGGGAPNWVLGAGYANKTEAPTDDLKAMVEEKIVSATGTYSATATTDINNTNTLAVILTFSDTAGAGTTTSTSSTSSSTSTSTTSHSTSSTSSSISTSTSHSTSASLSSTSASSTSSSTSISTTTITTSTSSTSHSTSTSTTLIEYQYWPRVTIRLRL